MIRREVQDSENVTWTCVQALSGLSGNAGDEAAERVESGDGKVPVVCTPSGGEQSGPRRATEVMGGGDVVRIC